RYERPTGIAALDDLHQVPAERAPHRLADFARLERIHRALELRHGIAGIDPAQVTALRGADVDRVGPRELGEIGVAVDDAIAQIREAPARLALGNELVRPDQDVACVALLHGSARAGAAALEEPQHVEADRAAQ